ncbi:PRC-barrel domain-containing protein [Mangrovibacillus cuniculi]|uniref:Photosystem reaction center subunit H n=1 Tax=Mangrovibacillus cuniculi TaxID=2593652 RepID=A0A7S8HFS9_9BACI|nr:PRC-barrel domain-containing protein [Mangrovibacillus cuniculi]QPC47062.1 photosystem reaction center subunit H [Mangrovibacillus cuniculi]
MKKSSEVKNLPIISLNSGDQLGVVKTLVVNPEKGYVDFLTIENEEWQTSVKAIPFKKIIGIGEFAVTIENEHSVIDLNEIPIANNLVNKNIRISDTRVMTRKGQLVGSVLEYGLNEDTGEIMGLELKVGSEQVIMPSSSVMTYGKDLLIVQEDALESTRKNWMENANEVLEQEVDSLSSLKEKQAELLVGKEVTKDIKGINGEVVVESGTILTLEDVKQAQAEGTSVFVELGMNVR